jgi:orotate phosphoribosyltransferase
MPAAIGGMSIGADPITAAVVAMSAVRGTPITGFMVRKEPKGHGTNQYLEGPVQPGDKVVIVEDVVTTGGSSLTAIQRAEQFGLKVGRVIAIIDRMEGGAEAFAQRGYKFSSLLTIRDFGIEPPEG